MKNKKGCNMTPDQKMKNVVPSEGDRTYVKGEMFIFLGGGWRNVKNIENEKIDPNKVLREVY